MSDLTRFRDPMKRMLDNGKSMDEVLAYLRSQGCTKVDCMWALEDYAGLTHGDAKRTVHESNAWADRREPDEALHEQLERDLKRAVRERPDGTLELP
jgi:hypothetical protein